MDFHSDHHSDGRRTEETVGLDIPPGLPEHGVPGGGERAEVRHRGAGHERARAAGRQAQGLQQPAQGDLFEKGRAGGRAIEHGILVPGAGEPVGGERDGQGAADDESEEPRAGHAHGGGRADFVEEPQGFGRIVRPGRERQVKRAQPRDRLGRGQHGPGLKTLEITDRPLSGVVQEMFHGVG